MESFYELEEEFNNIRLFGLVNNESMRLSIEEIPLRYNDNLKVKIINCFIYNVDVDSFKSLVNSIRKESGHGFKRACLVLKEQCKALFQDDYSITSKDIDCFCINPMKGYGFKVTGKDFEAMVTMDNIIANSDGKTLICQKPEQVKPIFRSIATGKMSQKYNGDVKQFIKECSNNSCTLQEIISF
jgi:hypothetical protein